VDDDVRYSDEKVAVDTANRSAWMLPCAGGRAPHCRDVDPLCRHTLQTSPTVRRAHRHWTGYVIIESTIDLQWAGRCRPHKKNCPHFPVLSGILGESGPSLVTPKNILQTLSRSVHPFSTAHGCDLQTDSRAGKNLVFKEKNIKVFKYVTFWVFRYFKSFKFYIL